MKIIFFGTPEYIVPLLEGLHKTYNRTRERELIAVVTQPPKPVGRDQKLEYSAVDTFAHKHKIHIFFDASEVPQADLGICAAYGNIIPQHAINQFSLGILNIHPSLLPEFRGASPIQATLVSGKETTGVTVIKMDSELDHGPIVSAFKSEVKPNDTNETLRNRLFEESTDFLLQLIPSFISGKITLKPQDHDKATYTKPTVKDDGYIPSEFLAKAIKDEKTDVKWAIRFMKDKVITPTPQAIENYIRALSPWPGTYTFVNIAGSQRRLKITKAHADEGKLILDEVQLEGKNAVTWKQFTEGYQQVQFI